MSDFYKHAAMADGHLNKCKACVQSRVKQHREENIESVKAYDRERGRSPLRAAARREYDKTAAGVAARLRASAKWNAENQHKKEAHHKVSTAIRSGRLVKKPCERCGASETVEAHHEDYSKPLDVVWLCDRDHKARHRELRWGAEELEDSCQKKA